jgi:hypothetical protein
MSEPEPSETELHRVTAPAATKRIQILAFPSSITALLKGIVSRDLMKIKRPADSFVV